MTTELNRLRASLRETLGRAFELPEVPRELHQQNEALMALLGGAGSGRPPRDRMREAIVSFRQTRKLATLGQARLVCFGAAERLAPAQPSLIEDEQWFVHLLAEVDDFHTEPRAFRRCYRGLLSTYFLFDPDATAQDQPGPVCHRKLRHYLAARLEQIRVEGTPLTWVEVIGAHRNLISEEPVSRYGAAMLRGDSSEFDQVRGGLEIDENSWLLRRVVLAQVRAAVGETDERFRGHVDPLIALLLKFPLQRDEGLALLVNRYQLMRTQPEHGGLRDATIEAWGSPWMTRNDAAWSRVSPDSRKMVRNWLNLKLIQQFFTVLAEDRHTDQRRVRFWEKYHTQVDEIFFALGPNAAYSRSTDIRRLREQMGPHLLGLTRPGNSANNAFIMKMGCHYIVEFGVSGNACFVFRADNLPFRLVGDVSADAEGLKHPERLHRLLHVDRSYDPWEDEFGRTLAGLGIRVGMDAATGHRQPEPERVPINPIETFSWRALRSLADEHGFAVEDLTRKGGRLWVSGPPEDGFIGSKLSNWGFRYARQRNAWYREESS